jgi:hypothetical protein
MLDEDRPNAGLKKVAAGRLGGLRKPGRRKCDRDG